MAHRNLLASHVPSAPAFIKWTAMARSIVAELAHLPAVGRSEDAAYLHARDTQGGIGFVADQAVVMADERRPLHSLMVERVKDDALPRIIRYHFHKRLLRHPPDGHAVV